MAVARTYEEVEDIYASKCRQERYLDAFRVPGLVLAVCAAVAGGLYWSAFEESQVSESMFFGSLALLAAMIAVHSYAVYNKSRKKYYGEWLGGHTGYADA